MALKENIEQELEELFNKINDNKIETETIEKLEKTIIEITENVENLDRVELSPYLDNVYKNQNTNIEEIKKELEVLKKLATAHRKMGGNFFSFNKEQKEFITKICLDAKEFITKSKENSSYSVKVKKYEEVLNKMKNNEKLSANDLNFILEFLKGKSPEEMKANLLDFYKHNLEIEKTRQNGQIEISEQQEKPTEKEMQKRIENVKEKVKEYDIYNKENLDEQVKKHNQEIGINVNVENTKKVLEVLEDLKIIDKFDAEAILALILYATPESIKQAYAEFNNKDNLAFENAVVYKFPSLWVEQDEKQRTTRVISQYKKHGGPNGKQNTTLKSAAKRMYRKELYEKISFYKAENLEKINLDEKQIESAYDPTLETIKRKLKDFRLYDVEPTGSCFSTTGDIKKGCDRLIECNLLTPGIKEKTYENYANNNPTIIASIKEDSILYAESLLGTDKEKSIFSTRNNKEPELSTEFRKIKVKAEDLDMVITKESNLDRYDEIQKVISKEAENDSILKEDYSFIQELDENFKESNYKYRIDNSIISRLKVIRIYNFLTDYNNTLREEEKLSEEDIRLFAITYNTYIKSDTYENIKNIAREKGGRTK